MPVQALTRHEPTWGVSEPEPQTTRDERLTDYRSRPWHPRSAATRLGASPTRFRSADERIDLLDELVLDFEVPSGLSNVDREEQIR
jgi:hypothetical protein